MPTTEEGSGGLARRAQRALERSRRIGEGLGAICRNSLAALGLGAVSLFAVAVWHQDVRQSAGVHLLPWLEQRHEARALASGDLLADLDRQQAPMQAGEPGPLPKAQAQVAAWLSRRYRVAPEPLARLVQEAWAMGHKASIDPLLILAVMAVESGFNPFAQTADGEQGLMQVNTRLHDDKFDRFGGALAAFDPLTNLRVGVQVLRDCIARAGGSLDAGLRLYVGASATGDVGGYIRRVLAEQDSLRQVAEGRTGPVIAAAQRPHAAEATASPAAPTTPPHPASVEPTPTSPASPASPAAAASQSQPQRVALLEG